MVASLFLPEEIAKMRRQIPFHHVLLCFVAWAAHVGFAGLIAWAENAPPRIMALGDSITAGYTDNSAWTVPYSYGYRSGLYTRLTNAHYSFQFVGGSQEPLNGAFGTVKTIDNTVNLPAVDQDYSRGYGGWKIDKITGNVSKWLNSDNPDVVLLMIGINDITKGSTANPTTAETSLNTLVTNIVAQRPNAYVIVAQITPYSTDTPAIVYYNNYIKNTLVPSFTAQGRRVSTVDQYSNFLTTGGSIDASLYSNGINHPNATGYNLMAQTWLSGIQALGSIATGPMPAQCVLANGGFETACFTDKSHNIDPAGAAWTFTPSSAGAGSGIDQSNPYGSSVTNSTASTGLQMGFLQGSGTGTTNIQQEVKGLIAGKTYSLSFQAKAIGGFGGVNPFHASVGGADLSFSGNAQVSPGSASYSQYAATFVATSATMMLRFYDAGNVSTSKVSWIDNVKLDLVTPSSGNLVAHGGFETTVFANNSHNKNPTGAGWRFSPNGSASAGAGIDRGNPYSVANSVAEAGQQMAYLQGSGTAGGTTYIEQDVTEFETGKSYLVSFQACAIEGFCGVNPFSVSIGGDAVAFNGDRTLVSPSANWALYCSDPFTASGPTMTLRICDAGNVPVERVSWLDDVQIIAVPEPSSLALMSIGATALLGYLWRLHKHRTR
jgi:lysophospholipase L1-like esterase